MKITTKTPIQVKYFKPLSDESQGNQTTGHFEEHDAFLLRIDKMLMPYDKGMSGQCIAASIVDAKTGQFSVVDLNHLKMDASLIHNLFED